MNGTTSLSCAHKSASPAVPRLLNVKISSCLHASMRTLTMDTLKSSSTVFAVAATKLRQFRGRVALSPFSDGLQSPESSANPVRSRFILHPNSSRSMAWRAFASTCAVLHAWVVPIFGLFDPPENSFVMILFRFTWAMLIVDVLVCSCTAKVDRDGDMVSATLSECASSYLRDKRGYIDILALIPFDTRALQDLYSSAPGLLSELAHANRLLVLYRVARWVQHLNGEVVLNMHLMWIAQSLVIGFLGINWMAALWWTVGQMDSNARDGKPSWVEMAARNPQWRHVFEKNTDGTWKRSWEVRYGLACYWVINSALIPEHSHFSVPSFQERWIGKVFFALSQTFLVWVAGSFTSSLANQRANRAVFQRRADVMADFLETSHLSKQLQQRVTRYMNHVWQRTRGIDPFTLLDDLPSTVHAELAMKAYKHLLIKVPLFEGADMAFLRAVCLALRPILFMAGDYIIRKGDLGAEMYLVLHGDVEIVSVDESGRETVLSTMRSGAYFGEISLYLSRPRTVSVRAKTAVDILVLPKHHLDPILKMYPDVHARIMSIAQEHLLKDAVRRGSEQSATAQAADTRLCAPATPSTPAIALEPASVLLRSQNGQQVLARALSGRKPPASLVTDKAAAAVDVQASKKRLAQRYRVVSIDDDVDGEESEGVTAVSSPARPRRPSSNSSRSATANTAGLACSAGSVVMAGSNGTACIPPHIQLVTVASPLRDSPGYASDANVNSNPSASENREGESLTVPTSELTHDATQLRQRSTSASFSRKPGRDTLLRTRLMSDGAAPKHVHIAERHGDNAPSPTSNQLSTPQPLLYAQPLLSTPHSQPLANAGHSGQHSGVSRAASHPDRLTTLIRNLTHSGRLSPAAQQDPSPRALRTSDSHWQAVSNSIDAPPTPHTTVTSTHQEHEDTAANVFEDAEDAVHASLDFLFFTLVPLQETPSTPFQSLDRSTAEASGTEDKQLPTK